MSVLHVENVLSSIIGVYTMDISSLDFTPWIYRRASRHRSDTVNLKK